MSDWDQFGDIDATAIGSRIRNLRLHLGISQIGLSREAGCSQQMVCSLERGGVKLPRNLPRLAEVLGTSPRWIITGVAGDGAPIFDCKTYADLVAFQHMPSTDLLSASQKFLEPTSGYHPGAFAMRAPDDSMDHDIAQQDFIIVDPNIIAHPGDVLLVRDIDGLLTLRRLKATGPNEVDLVPANQNYYKISGSRSELNNDDTSKFGIVGTVIEIRKLRKTS